MKRIGILGGGQLARMLALRAHSLGLIPYVLSPSSQDPAGQVTAFHHKGSTDSEKDLLAFSKCVDILTFESEFVHARKLEKILKKTKKPSGFFQPSLKNLARIQDRLSQKKLLTIHKLPTSSFVDVPLGEDREACLQALLTRWQALVLKTRHGGYDGYGTFVVKTRKDIKNLPPVPAIAEAFVPFKRELAVTACRNKRSQIVFFPLVETHQKKSQCFWVKGPVQSKKFARLKRQITRFLNKINYVGAITFELFETQKDLLVNELAPRVHNSAHYSWEALSEDQFTLHLKACCAQDLHTPKLVSPGFAMLNLLGSSQACCSKQLASGLYLHWYSKKVSKKGRKMGHITSLQASSLKALNKLLKLKKKMGIRLRS